MKEITIKVTDELFAKLECQVTKTGQSVDSYLANLIQNSVETSGTIRTLCFRIPGSEYRLLKIATAKRGCTVKDFVKCLVADDLKGNTALARFQAEDTSGCGRTISFQISSELYRGIKLRLQKVDMSLQDYMRTLIYAVTHEG